MFWQNKNECTTCLKKKAQSRKAYKLYSISLFPAFWMGFYELVQNYVDKKVIDPYLYSPSIISIYLNTIQRRRFPFELIYFKQDQLVKKAFFSLFLTACP